MKLLLVIASLVVVAFDAECSHPPDPCAVVDCRFFARCVVQNGKPRCICGRACPRILRPVCGTDGKTYSNDCLLKVASCLKQKDIRVKHIGRCNPCSMASCRFGAKCVAKFGKAKCVCNRVCTKILKPACGTDGKTYNNACLLRVARCLKQKNIRKKHKGRCNPCGGVRCRLGQKCVVEHRVGVCKIPSVTCAAVLCIQGTKCVIKNGRPVCVPARPLMKHGTSNGKNGKTLVNGI